MAMDKYEKSLKNFENYQQIKEEAKDLYVPVFGLKRFLYFIGYDSVATRPATH
jgi:hypothetical protein